jgi:hypothetical protein
MFIQIGDNMISNVFDKYNDALRRKGIKMMSFIGKDTTKLIKQKSLEKKTGKIYFIYTKNGTKKKHIASSPSEFPAKITGNYNRGLASVVKGVDKLVIGNTVKYSPFLERGTSKMARREPLQRGVIEILRKNNIKKYLITLKEK